MSSTTAPYPYPLTNSELIKAYHLESHFEGGHFAQTVLLESGIPHPSNEIHANGLPISAALGGKVQIASGSGSELLPTPRSLAIKGSKTVDATQIFYLLTPESYRGRMHMNLHSTFHVHHVGRALYTLIEPPSSQSSKPTIHRVVMGANPNNGEVLQLFVPGGWWKASEIPEEDRLLLDTANQGSAEESLKERIGCLISEVVVPGWNPDQHQFIDEDKLKAMWNGQSGWEPYTKYIKAPEGLEYPEK